VAEFTMNFHRRTNDCVSLRIRVHIVPADYAHKPRKSQNSSAKICVLGGKSFFQRHIAAGDPFQPSVIRPQQQCAVVVQ
jgi:hypothetical protein